MENKLKKTFDNFNRVIDVLLSCFKHKKTNRRYIVVKSKWNII